MSCWPNIIIVYVTETSFPLLLPTSFFLSFLPSFFFSFLLSFFLSFLLSFFLSQPFSSSSQSHSCVEKAAMIGFVKLRILDTDETFRLRGSTLKKAIEVRSILFEEHLYPSTISLSACLSLSLYLSSNILKELSQLNTHLMI